MTLNRFLKNPKMSGFALLFESGFKTSMSAHRSDSPKEKDNSKKKELENPFVVGISLSGDDDLSKQFEACVKNDFPICLDEALKVIFGSSEKESLDLVLQRARRGNYGNLQKITTPEGIWELYKRVIQEFQKELGGTRCKIIETESTSKMRLIHCEKCPLYKFELHRLQEWYK